MSHHFLLIIHLICAAIWVGGHIYIMVCILPKCLHQRNASRLLQFEKSFEPLGMPALVLLVITGIWMLNKYGIPISQLFSFSSPIERVGSVKILLLFATVLFAISAQTRVIPKLKKDSSKLPEMAVHIIAVTLIGIALLVLGSFVRYGGI